jgi:hypothetical protein
MEIRRNHVFKPASWKVTNWTNSNWRIDSGIELRWVSRVLIEGNVVDTAWAGQGSQAQSITGALFEIFPKDRLGTAPNALINDVVIRYNQGRHGSMCFRSTLISFHEAGTWFSQKIRPSKSGSMRRIRSVMA